MLGVRADLREIGHDVTSQWILHGPEITANDPSVDLHANALMDLNDVVDADAFILFNDVAGGRGGRHVEFGYALALKIGRIFIVGERTNVFCHMKTVELVVPHWEVLRFFLQTEAGLYK